MEQPEKVYDYVFCGMGAAASLVIIQLEQRGLLTNASVLIIDKNVHSICDKTFCFWDLTDRSRTDQFEQIDAHHWNNVILPNGEETSLDPYQYNHISGKSLHKITSKISERYHWKTIVGTITEIQRTSTHFKVTIDDQSILGKYIFDSRTPSFHTPTGTSTHIHQSFIGWRIRLNNPLNNPQAFRLMDFNVPQLGFTQFMYVLPFSPYELLVELTRFGSEKLTVTEANAHLEAYILQEFGSFEIMEKEYGCIPMSTTAIKHESIPGVVLLGAKNYAIKPSTGYAFKAMYKDAVNIADSLSASEDPSRHNRSFSTSTAGRFKFYDRLLLDILNRQPACGSSIFRSLFQGSPTSTILKFLDEKTSLKEEILLFAKLPLRPFVKALIRHLYYHPLSRPIFLLLFSILATHAHDRHPFIEVFTNCGLLLGLLLIGIPHGAIDHLTISRDNAKNKTAAFVLRYLMQISLIACLWVAFPQLALLVFLLYSAWHFGETDGIVWRLSKPTAYLWGVSVLTYIISTHKAESDAILSSMADTLGPPALSPYWIFIWFTYFFVTKRFNAMITTLVLYVSSHCSLPMAFGIYFIGQHSITGWYHLKETLKKKHTHLWLKALPFNAGSWLLFAAFYFANTWFTLVTGQSLIGIFFIFLACISFPHVVAMHTLYKARS